MTQIQMMIRRGQVDSSFFRMGGGTTSADNDNEVGECGKTKDACKAGMRNKSKVFACKNGGDCPQEEC